MKNEQMGREIEPMTLGLVTGLGVGAGVFYYRALVNAHAARALIPRIVMVHADVRRVMGLANARESRELADYLAGLLRQLAGGGAQIATIPAFSPQVCARELAERTPLPLIGLLDAIVEEVRRRHLLRVAVFGARVTMETALFGRLRDVTDVVSPRLEEIEQVSNIYGNIVKNEKASSNELAVLRTVAHSLIQRESLDAILLAGTDFSFVLDPEKTDFPHLDGARTHVDAIMRVLAGPAGEPPGAAM
jgi:aspartate racemase